MSWLYNVDYENFLFSGAKRYSFNSSRINQEFEYVLNFFEDDAIYTQKVYPSEYLGKIESWSGRKFSLTSDPSKVRPWCCPVGTVESDRKLHSKATSARIAIEQGWESEIRILNAQNFRPVPGRLYKSEGGFSGSGHHLWPKGRAAIEKILKGGGTLIEEPLRRRTLDFSSLMLGPNNKRLYVNLVDDRFQYKGTLLKEPSLNKAQRERYERALEELEAQYLALGAQYPFSVDSYLYWEDGEEKLCVVSEVNARKTMGYIAAGLEAHFGLKAAALLLEPKKSASSMPKSAFLLAPPDAWFELAVCELSDFEGSRLNSGR